MPQLRDPKKIIDAVGDSIVTGISVRPKTGANLASVASNSAGAIRGRMNEVKAGMPEDPSVILRALVGALGDTVGAAFDLFDGFLSDGIDTAREVKSKIDEAVR